MEDKEIKVIQELQVQLEILVHKVKLVHRDHKEILEIKESLAQLVHKVHKV